LPTESYYDGYDLEPAYELAREQLTKISDIEQLRLRNGARCQTRGSQREIIIEYLNQFYQSPVAG